ncbi:MAG: 2-deoxyribose-5-phosphate aldolase, partial [Atribacterota bacterium]
MNREELIERVTREVLARLRGDSRGREECACPEAQGGGLVLTPRDIARYIDHTLLRPDATRSMIEKLCD